MRGRTELGRRQQEEMRGGKEDRTRGDEREDRDGEDRTSVVLMLVRKCLQLT